MDVLARRQASERLRAGLRVDDYLTDGKRLVQVLALEDDGFVLAEDVRGSCDVPAPVVKVRDLAEWRKVVPR